MASGLEAPQHLNAFDTGGAFVRRAVHDRRPCSRASSSCLSPRPHSIRRFPPPAGRSGSLRSARSSVDQQHCGVPRLQLSDNAAARTAPVIPPRPRPARRRRRTCRGSVQDHHFAFAPYSAGHGLRPSSRSPHGGGGLSGGGGGAGGPLLSSLGRFIAADLTSAGRVLETNAWRPRPTGRAPYVLSVTLRAPRAPP